MKTAREVVCEALSNARDSGCRGGTNLLSPYDGKVLMVREHSASCDAATAAVEADRLSREPPRDLGGRGGSLSSARSAPRCGICASRHPGKPCEKSCPCWDDIAGILDDVNAPSDTDTHLEQPNQALFVAGPFPACPACESLVLPTGKCVNGCEPAPATEPKT